MSRIGSGALQTFDLSPMAKRSIAPSGTEGIALNISSTIIIVHATVYVLLSRDSWL